MKIASSENLQFINQPERFLRLSDILSITGCGKSTIYQLIREGKFPAPIKISTRISVWPESDIKSWVEDRISFSKGL